MHTHVIFRTCDVVYSVHRAPRPFGLDKQSLIKLCFESLLQALAGHSHSIHVLGDKLSDELVDYFKRFDVTFSNGVLGNDESIRQSLRLALERDDDDWIYFCEDDYLHHPDCFRNIIDFVEHREEILLTKPKHNLRRLATGSLKGKLSDRPLFIHPPDYPDRYLPRYRNPGLLFLSQYCHWRQIANTTFTFLAERKSIKKFEKELMHSAKGANDAYLSKTIYGRSHFFGRALCVSPIPGLATHMHEGVMSPLVDWDAVRLRVLNNKRDPLH
jgi:hypothetical protein